jgi:hypothetical protein
MTNVPSGWRKSSFSATQTDCVEVARTLRKVRDSKNPSGEINGDVSALASRVRAGLFDR